MAVLARGTGLLLRLMIRVYQYVFFASVGRKLQISTDLLPIWIRRCRYTRTGQGKLACGKTGLPMPPLGRRRL